MTYADFSVLSVLSVVHIRYALDAGPVTRAVVIALIVTACAADAERDARPADSVPVRSSRAQARDLHLSAPACTTSQMDGNAVSACEIPPAQVALLQIAPAPHPERRNWTIAALDSSVRANGRKLALATNAGIFQQNGKPSGLLIRSGRELSKLALGDGPSARDPNRCAVNFYCMPNAVFYVAGGKAHVDSARQFARTRPLRATITLATQSGPMLVAGGKPARRFPATFGKRIPRNAACVRADGSVVLVFADNQTHASLADVLIARFACRDAVFLDGNISTLYTGGGAAPSLFDYGAIIYLAR